MPPVVCLWVIASKTCFLYLLPPRVTPHEGLRLLSEQTFFTFSTAVTLHSYSPMKMEQTEEQKFGYSIGAQAIFRAKRFAFSTAVTLHTYPPMKMEQRECSGTLAFKLQTPMKKAYDSCENYL
jgi:hypothetical protein